MAGKRLLVLMTMVVVAALCSLLAPHGASASGSLTIGQVFSAASTCAPAEVAQPSLSTYTLPSGTWRVTSWSTYANSGGGSMELLVLAPTGTPDSYTVVGASPIQTLTPGVLNSFALSSPIVAVGGDVIGMFESGAGCIEVTGSDSANYTITSSAPTVGSVVSLPSVEPTARLNIAATLQSAVGGSHLGYCSVAGNTLPDGTAILPGTFLNLEAGQPDGDPHYTGATPAYYYQGLGISCDRLPGYTATGELVGYNGQGDDRGGTYAYMAKSV